ncbi:hypothetical protein C8Q74DRAFT_1006650 [Fomes fomentarius]|nr:hypothetical protein C8Q74DRAFT_1006650 [Fomes fomentarius]
MDVLPMQACPLDRIENHGCYPSSSGTTPYGAITSRVTGNTPYAGAHPGGLEALSTPQETLGWSPVECTPNSTSLQHARMHEGRIPSNPYAHDSQESIESRLPIFSRLTHSLLSPHPSTLAKSKEPKLPLNHCAFSESIAEASLAHHKGQNNLYFGIPIFCPIGNVEPGIGTYCEGSDYSPYPNCAVMQSDLHMDNLHQFCPTPPTPFHHDIIPTTGTPVRCQWDGCAIELDDITHGGLRRHFRDRHYQARGTLTHCVWEQNCRSERMLFENIPKHIAECHLKSMKQECPGCHGVFARKDTLKRHITSGCPSGYQGPVQ